MTYSEEFLAGWQAARAQYQVTGGVQPYPPGHEVSEGSVEVEASEGIEPAKPKARARRAQR